MKKTLLREALRIAREKLCNHPKLKETAKRSMFIHYSFVVQDNKIVEYGYNRSEKEPPKTFGYHDRFGGNDWYIPGTHSEVDAYRKAKGLMNKNKPFEIINIRLNRQGEIRLSAPCKCCHQLLQEFGCKTFYYTTDVGMSKIV
jgi:hypothetical protein